MARNPGSMVGAQPAKPHEPPFANGASLDLSGLARPRSPAEPPAPPRSWFTRYVLPAAILLGLAALLASVAFERFRPRKAVSVVPVLLTYAEVQEEGQPLFQAPGWIEPRPAPIQVTALTEGVVEEVYVVEGQDVQAGDTIACLVEIDTQLACRDARSALALRQAEVAAVKAEVAAARLRFEQPVHLQAELAAAKSQLAQIRSAQAALPFQQQSAQARLNFAAENRRNKEQAAVAIAANRIEQARSEHQTALAELEQLQAREKTLAAEAAAAAEQVEALAQRLKLLIDESAAVETAEARLAAAEARRDAAAVAVEQAELAHARTVIRAPVAGRVLSVDVRPGSKLMGLSSSARQDSSTVATLYDPARLQVRVDVRLEDVPRVQPGQRVQITTAALAEPLEGRVLLPTSAANIQKNTLDVKVAIVEPDTKIRPEMLATVTFIAPPRAVPESPGGSNSPGTQDASGPLPLAQRLLIPAQLVATEGEQNMVWIVADGGVARRRAIELGGTAAQGLVEVVRGLQPTDRLIAQGQDGLTDGAAVEVVSEDRALGVSAAAR